MNRKTVGVAVALISIGFIVGALFIMAFAPQVLDIKASVGVGLESATVKPESPVHCRVTFYKAGVLYAQYEHPGVVTNLGDNMTLYKMFNYSSMQYGSLNASSVTAFISIGNDTGTLGASSTVLPNEWHREASTYEDATQSQHNFTCTISGADIPGVEVADCIGLCLTETDDANDLWAYDTFNEVTGIDDSFTINVEFQVTVSHS